MRAPRWRTGPSYVIRASVRTGASPAAPTAANPHHYCPIASASGVVRIIVPARAGAGAPETGATSSAPGIVNPVNGQAARSPRRALLKCRRDGTSRESTWRHGTRTHARTFTGTTALWRQAMIWCGLPINFEVIDAATTTSATQRPSRMLVIDTIAGSGRETSSPSTLIRAILG